MLFYSVLNVVREGLLMQVVFACWKQIRFLSSFLNLFLLLPVVLFLVASVDHVWKYILPSIFYSQQDFLQDIIENNWNKHNGTKCYQIESTQTYYSCPEMPHKYPKP